MSTQSETQSAAREKLESQSKRESNAETVETIATVGQYGAMGIAVGGAIYAGSCVALPLVAGFACAMKGAEIAQKLEWDSKALDLMGVPKMAKPGPQPACKTHKIAHNHPFGGALGGLIGGLIAGLVVGALVAAAATAILATGGLAAPLLVAVVAGAAGGAAGGFVGATIGGIGSKWATVSGHISEGSPTVFFENKQVARLTDPVICNKHSPPTTIVEGSKTIYINSLPLARIGHKISCSAVLQEGCTSIFADNTTQQVGKPDAELSVVEQLVVSGLEVGLAISSARRGGLLNKLLRWALGEPIDAATGDYMSYRTDLNFPGVLPLQLTRAYSGKESVDGLLGTKWVCNWSQRILYDPNQPIAVLEDAEGQRLEFALGCNTEFKARNLKSPYYHLTGTRNNASLFDTRSQQTLIFTTNEHDPQVGRLTAIEDRNRNRIDFIYSGKHLRNVIHSDGTSFTITTNTEGYLKSIVREGSSSVLVRYEYDANGAITEVNSLFEGEFHYTYNEQGWLNHWHDSGATSADLAYDSHGRVISTRTPDGMYNDHFIYHPEEHKTEYIDATGACRTLWFNKNNLLIREQDPLGNVILTEWDGMERKQSTTDALGRTICFEYDTLGLLTSETDWADRSTKLAYDKSGLITRIDYPDGTNSAWKYDDRGNLTSATGPGKATIHFSYDERGNLIHEIGPDGATSLWEYTPQGHLSAWRDPLGNRTTFHLDSWERPRKVTDPAGHSTRYEYDLSADNPRADLSRVIHADGGEEHFAYDREGLLATHIAQEGQTTRYQHGAFDLLRSIIDPKGHGTLLEYDGAARLKKITNAQGQSWTYSYDLAGRLAAETDWAGRQTKYVRDAIGRVLTKRLPDGIEQHLTWDELDRIAAVTTEKQRITYEYDQADRLIRAATWTKTNTEPESDLLFSYDDKGRLAKEIQNGLAIEYKYDQTGRCISRTGPSGETSYEFDLLGQFAGLNSNGHTLDFTRDNRGLETLRHYRSEESPSPVPDPRTLNAFSLKQSYDPCGRLTSQRAGQPRQSAAHEKLAEINRKYTWDKSGRLVGLKDNKRGTSSYHYDPRDQVNRISRITGLNKQSEEQYSYDALMNLAFSKGAQHQYENGTVRTIGTSSYRYDVRGRLKEKRVAKNGFRPKTWQYSWDDFDRLTETHTPDGSIWRYNYDAFGRRIKKECVKAGDSGRKSSVTYIWQGATLAEEMTTNGDKVEATRWHFEPGTFNPLAKEANGTFYPIVTDHLGTPKELFDTEGNCVWQAEHSLWGETEVTFARKPDGYQPLVDCNLRFQNQWEDKETGLYYNLNRYYDPDSGQYLSIDPIGLEGGLRTHGYVHDPMLWVDPLGLAGCPKGSGEHRIPARFKKDLKGGGSWLMTEEQYLAYAKGRRMVGRPDGQFMTSAKNMNKLINKTGGDPVQLGQKLGIDNWTSNTKLIRMDVVDPLNYNPRMPSASMNGSNNLFKPGGLTSGGVPEIATDLLPSSQVWATPIN